LQSITANELLRLELHFLSFRNSSNEEDFLFSKKDYEMLKLRQHKITNEVVRVLSDIRKTIADE